MARASFIMGCLYRPPLVDRFDLDVSGAAETRSAQPTIMTSLPNREYLLLRF